MPFLFTPNANMYIDQYNGIIGIGTNTPTSNLHVIGSSIITGNLNVSGFASISSVSFSSSITLTGLVVNNALNVSTTGNVGIGIGTAVSNSNIHVQGTSRFLSSTGLTGMYINSLGNVGINSSNPQYNLDVIGTMRCSNVTVFQGPPTSSIFGASLGMEGQHCSLQLSANVGNDSYIDFSTSGSDFLGRIMYSSTANVMLFNTRLTEKMRIDAGGNVGINSSTPSSILDVNGNINTTSNYLKNGIPLACGLFTPTNVSSIVANTDIQWSSVFSNNLTLISNSIIQLPQQGIYKFEIMLNFTTGVSGIQDIILYYATTSGGSYTIGLGASNGFSSGVSGATTFFYSYLYSTSANGGSLFVKFTYPNFGPNSTSTFDTGASTYWSRLQVHQII